MEVLLVALGVLAGALTTLAGQGGGTILLLALAAAVGPHRALAMSTVALCIGNVHRVITFRRWIAWRVARPLMTSTILGSVMGGAFAAKMPALWLKAIIVSMTALGIASRYRKGAKLLSSNRGLGAGGLLVGLLTGTSGGAGFLLAPLTMGAGLTGEAYMATQSIAAVTIHIGRLAAYAHGGLYRNVAALDVVLLTVSILFGNVIAQRFRGRISPVAMGRIEVAVLAGCAIVVLVTR
jgi:uncharacterized membrane protein YfcA